MSCRHLLKCVKDVVNMDAEDDALNTDNAAKRALELIRVTN